MSRVIYTEKSIEQDVIFRRLRFYRFANSPKSVRAERDKELLERIKAIHQDSRETYGSVRIHRKLTEEGEQISRKRVVRLMQTNHIVAKCTRAYKTTTKSKQSDKFAPNLLAQNFHATRPNQKWASDITFIPTNQGWGYLAVILDLYSRTVVGMSMSNRITQSLVINAFQQAVLHRNPPKQLLYHSDRGSQYTSLAFQQLMQDYNIVVSMSGKGNCYDNSAMESFFHTLKTELVHHERYQTREQAILSIFDYTETFYNYKRMHSYLDYVSPREFEIRYYQQLITLSMVLTLICFLTRIKSVNVLLVIYFY